MLALRLKSLSQPAELRAAVANDAGTVFATAWRQKRACDAPPAASTNPIVKAPTIYAKSARRNRGVRPMAAPLDGGLAGLVHPRKNGSNVVVITSALHAVGRRFEPGIQYDSLFFAPRGPTRHGRHTLIFTRASRGRRVRRRCAVVNSSYIQTPPLLLGHARRHGQRERGGGRERRREVEVEAIGRHLGELEHDVGLF